MRSCFIIASHWLWQRGWLLAGRFVSHLGRMLTGIEIHPGARIGRRLFIDHGMGVVIGETAEIGDDCTLYQGVTLGGTSLTRGAKRHPTLGNDVIVGSAAQILGPFRVGDGARIGAHAVVLSEVPDGATMVGNPGAPACRAARRSRAAAEPVFQPYGDMRRTFPIRSPARSTACSTRSRACGRGWRARERASADERRCRCGRSRRAGSLSSANGADETERVS